MQDVYKKLEIYREKVNQQRREIDKRVIGMPILKEALLICFYAFSGMKSVPHLLVEGKVGGGKTVLLETFSQTIADATFKRIQFRPDLQPFELLKIVDRREDGSFVFCQGPIFANLVLADEINRAHEKTRAAMLEAMAEEQVTVGETTSKLDQPFFVMATENPSETEGVYRLGAAHSDRFMMKVYTEPLSKEEEIKLLRLHQQKSPEIEQVITKEEVLGIREFIRDNIFVSPKIVEIIVDIVRALRPGGGIVQSKDFYLLPESERADIFLGKVAMVKAFLGGRNYVIPSDVECLAFSVLHHRMEFKDSSDDFETNILKSRKVISQAVKKVIDDEARRS